MTILMITAMLALFIGMTRRRLLGGAFGGAASGLAATLLGSGGFGPILLLAVAIGALVGAIASTMATGSSGNQWTGGRDRRGGWGGGFPGGYGGGGFGGGGSGEGGGFSGGGGGFGGGGASGDW